MSGAVERLLDTALAGGDFCIGEVRVTRREDGTLLACHRDDCARPNLESFSGAERAIEIAKFDDAGKYRPLKTAPTLRHGWSLEIVDATQLRRALDYFYPGRLAILEVFERRNVTATPLRETLDRQSGMYRAAASITDKQVDELVGNFCRSDGGCLRTILWKRDARGTEPSTRLPREKFDPAADQFAAVAKEPRSPTAATVPLLCQEACALLVEAARKVVKEGRDVSPKRP